MTGLLVHSLIILLLASSAAAQQKPQAEHAPASKAATPMPFLLPSEETVNAFLQQMFGYDPSVSWKVISIHEADAEGLAEVVVRLANPHGSQGVTLYVTADRKHALVGEMIPFGEKPFAEDRQKLEKGINGVARGPARAPVTIVEFSDLQCPHCKQAQPTIEKLMGDEPNARFVFQQFPLPSHDWAAKAALYADCVGRANQDAFWKFVNGVFQAQSEITPANADEKLAMLADSVGVKGTETATCATHPETKARVDTSVALGRSVHVPGTPALFVNGRLISNVNNTPYETLKAMVDFAAKP